MRQKLIASEDAGTGDVQSVPDVAREALAYDAIGFFHAYAEILSSQREPEPVGAMRRVVYQGRTGVISFAAARIAPRIPALVRVGKGGGFTEIGQPCRGDGERAAPSALDQLSPPCHKVRRSA